MPRRNLSVLSKEEDPYTLNRFPREFAVTIGKQTYNARQLAKAAKVKGQYLDMYRQPIPAAKVREIMALTGQRPHANTGRFIPASQLAKLRKLAKRELLARQGKSVVGPMQYRATARPTAAAVRFGVVERQRWNDNHRRAYLRLVLEEVVRTGTVLARRKFRELDARGVFRDYDEDQRGGAESGLVHRFRRAHLYDRFPVGTRVSGAVLDELASRLPRIQSLPAHAQEVAWRFITMTPGDLDALTRLPPLRRSARISRR
jgi:hypothetical protein